MPATTLNDYQQRGFAIECEPVLTQDAIKAAREGMDAIRAGLYDTGQAPERASWKPGDDPNALCKIDQPHLSNQAIAACLRTPALGARIAEITGAKMVQVWAVQLLYKPPSKAQSAKTTVGWHRDWTYWTESWEAGSEVFTAWLAISDVVENSGPMKYVPGSHTWETKDGGNFFDAAIGKESFQVPTGCQWEEAPAVMPAGAFSLHHSQTIHGSSENRSLLPRRSFAIHLRTEHSRPLTGGGENFARHIGDRNICPIIFGEPDPSAF